VKSLELLFPEAARIIYLLVKNPDEGKKKKKIFDQDVGLLETCLESVPSAFIITVIWVSAGHLYGENMNTIFAYLVSIKLFNNICFSYVKLQHPGKSEQDNIQC